MRHRLLAILGWLVGPERLIALTLFVLGLIGSLAAGLPAVVILLIALAFFVVGLAGAHYGVLILDRVRQRSGPNLVVHDPETHYAALQTGELFAAVKVPFANRKDERGRGITETGFHAEYRLIYEDSGEVAWEWTQARWDENPQQHELGPGASLTAPAVRTIRLEPNGLKHYMETVIQVQGLPPEGEPRVLEPWTQAGRTGVGIQSPLIVEIRWEGNEIPEGSQRMRVTASEPPDLAPQGAWLT